MREFFTDGSISNVLRSTSGPGKMDGLPLSRFYISADVSLTCRGLTECIVQQGSVILLYHSTSNRSKPLIETYRTPSAYLGRGFPGSNPPRNESVPIINE